MAELIEFAIATGKRESEITSLLRSDVDIHNRTALLRDAKHPRSKECNHRRFPLLGHAAVIVESHPIKKGDGRLLPYN